MYICICVYMHESDPRNGSLGRLSNAHIRQTLGIRQTIEEIVSERRLRWFGHVSRNSEMINASYKQHFQKARKRGRPLKDGPTPSGSRATYLF